MIQKEKKRGEKKEEYVKGTKKKKKGVGNQFPRR